MSPVGYFACQVLSAHVPPHRHTAISAEVFWWQLKEIPLRAKLKLSLFWHIPFVLLSALRISVFRLLAICFPVIPPICAPPLCSQPAGGLFRNALPRCSHGISALLLNTLACLLPRLPLRLQDKLCSRWKVPLARQAHQLG